MYCACLAAGAAFAAAQQPAAPIVLRAARLLEHVSFVMKGGSIIRR